jgi:hypothetical protein
MLWRRVSGCSIRGIKLTMKNHISVSIFIESRSEVTWISKVEIDHTM